MGNRALPAYKQVVNRPISHWSGQLHVLRAPNMIPGFIFDPELQPLLIEPQSLSTMDLGFRNMYNNGHHFGWSPSF